MKNINLLVVEGNVEKENDSFRKQGIKTHAESLRDSLNYYSKDINFSYRKCSLDKDLIFISATLQGKKDDKIVIGKKIRDFTDKKKRSQPSKIKTCGSTFKNPKNTKAWRLIKDAHCAGIRVGDAYISDKHCNFFVNKGNAKSKDLENLIHLVKSKVFEKTGINLELEIKIIGEKL